MFQCFDTSKNFMTPQNFSKNFMTPQNTPKRFRGPKFPPGPGCPYFMTGPLDQKRIHSALNDKKDDARNFQIFD